MNKAVLVSLAILTLSTSSVLAAQQTRHARAMNSNAAMGAAPPATMAGSKDQDMYMKNLHDSGYDPKNDFTTSGHMREK